jgi:hypothetical protein
MKQFQSRVAMYGVSAAAVDFDKDEMNRLLAKLPHQPNERLR